MASRFEIKQNGRGEFRFVLTSNGRVLATSEPYTRKSSCLNAIESLRKAAVSASVAEDTTQTAPVKAARAAGRAVGKAKAKVGTTVAKVEKAAAPRKRAASATKAAKAAAPRKRAARPKR